MNYIETDNERVYDNGIKTVLLREGWYGFKDLLQVPFIRQAYAKQIEDNFIYGTNAFDMNQFFTEMKALAKSNDAEKYEKIYALVLKKEEAIAAIQDPFKQHLALCAVYVLAPDEDINLFDQEAATAKIKSWDSEECLFFINWLSDNLLKYAKVINLLGTITEKIKADANV